jgi:hypothetical protein
LSLSEIQIPGNSEKELWANCGSAVLQSKKGKRLEVGGRRRNVKCRSSNAKRENPNVKWQITDNGHRIRVHAPRFTSQDNGHGHETRTLSEGIIGFTDGKHIPMKDQLVRKNRGGKTRKLRG